MSVRNIGPAGMSGRVTAIDVDRINNIIYIGSASGGVWKSENKGISWKPIFDDQITQSIGSLKVNPKNPLEIWVGTGEGNPRNSHNAGLGIFKTIDGGKTWKRMGLENTRLIHRVLIDFDNPNIVYAGVMGSAWGPSTEKGVYKTIDGGKSWNKILYINDSTGVGEMIMDPQNPKKLIVNMWQFWRKPWQMKSGGKHSGIHITYDGGETWKKLSSKDGIPDGDLGKCGLAIAASNPSVVYALIEAKENALFKSINGGESWHKVAEDKGFNGRPFYFYEIYVDPKDENTIYSLHTYVHKSIDGGKTFKSIADYGNAVHPDHHAFWIDPSNTNYVIDGNDGGLNFSYDGGETWQFAQNLPIGQFYHLNVDNDFPYKVYGGMQDNGSWVGFGFTLSFGGIRNSDWQEVYFGDGFDVAALPADSRYGFAMSQGGDLAKYDLVTGKVDYIKPVHPEGLFLRFNWNAALAMDPHNPRALYYGSQFVHYSTNEGVDWKIISPDLTTNDTVRQPKESGGLTSDITGAEFNTTILCIAPSPVNKNVIWVGTDDGNIQITQDGGLNWVNLLNNIPGAPNGSWIPQIEVSAKHAGTAFVVLNNYRRNDYKPYLFYTEDFGKSWKNLADPTQVKGFVNCIVQDKLEPNLLFLGADDGLYVSFDRGMNWNHWVNNFPHVQIQDMKIQPEFNDLVIATFGRAFWVIDDIAPLRKIVKQGKSLLDKEFAILGSPDAYQVNYKSFAGTRFYAQNDFHGDNKNVGAGFLVRCNFDEKKYDKKRDSIKLSDNKAKIKIVDSNNNIVREYKEEIKDTGVVKIGWGMRMNGTRIPRKDEPKPDENIPSGAIVDPGQYKVIIQWRGNIDSSVFQIKQDPRSQIKLQAIQNIRTIANDVSLEAEKLAMIYDKIRDANKAVEIIEKLITVLPDSTQKTIKSICDTQKKKIKEINVEMFGPDSGKGYEADPDDVMTNYNRANNYINASGNEIGTNVKNQINIFKKKSSEINIKMNKYLNEDFTQFKKSIEGYKLSPFK
ncbi:MAG: hypothetical protein HOP11_08230 [Saprospiraceae bacterium]|nr:hypothetical protein [Saprospiraceae bacterium]